MTKNERPNYRKMAEDLTRELDTTKGKLAEANKNNDELAKKLDAANGSSAYWSKIASEREAQINDVHVFLDVLKDAPPRETSELEQYRRTTLSPQARFAVWMASHLQIVGRATSA